MNKAYGWFANDVIQKLGCIRTLYRKLAKSIYDGFLCFMIYIRVSTRIDTRSNSIILNLFIIFGTLISRFIRYYLCITSVLWSIIFFFSYSSRPLVSSDHWSLDHDCDTLFCHRPMIGCHFFQTIEWRIAIIFWNKSIDQFLDHFSNSFIMIEMKHSVSTEEEWFRNLSWL